MVGRRSFVLCRGRRRGHFRNDDATSMLTSDLLAARLSCDDLLSTRLGRSWSLEPRVATLSFAAFMRLFRLYEEKRPTSVFGPPFHFSTRAIGSLFVYWLGVAMWVCIVPRPVGAASGCPHNVSDYFHLAAEVAAGLISYDFLFFFVHLLMHHSARFGSWTNHAQHHKFTHDESSYRTVNHSLVDGTMQVLVNILVQRHTPWGAPKTSSRGCCTMCSSSSCSSSRIQQPASADCAAIVYRRRRPRAAPSAWRAAV